MAEEKNFKMINGEKLSGDITDEEIKLKQFIADENRVYLEKETAVCKSAFSNAAVLEVGAGIGLNSSYIINNDLRSYVSVGYKHSKNRIDDINVIGDGIKRHIDTFDPYDSIVNNGSINGMSVDICITECQPSKKSSVLLIEHIIRNNMPKGGVVMVINSQYNDAVIHKLHDRSEGKYQGHTISEIVPNILVLHIPDPNAPVEKDKSEDELKRMHQH